MNYTSIVYFIVAALFIGSAWRMVGFVRWGLYIVGCVWLTLGLWKTRLEMAQEQREKERVAENENAEDGEDE